MKVTPHLIAVATSRAIALRESDPQTSALLNTLTRQLGHHDRERQLHIREVDSLKGDLRQCHLEMVGQQVLITQLNEQLDQALSRTITKRVA